MDLGLSGRVAFITGASRGLGRAIALRLAGEGMSIALAARDEAGLRAVAAAAQAAGARTFVHAGDLSTPAAPAGFATAALAEFGRVDLIVNNAGATPRGDFLALTDQQWSDGFALKFYAAVRLSRAAWPSLMETGGSIVNIAGVGGITGDAEFTIGGAVNAAMLNLTKCLADRGTRDGVRVNAIAPGTIATDRLGVRVKRIADERQIAEADAARQMLAKLNIARFGQPDEIAAAVAYLASGVAGYANGCVLTIDGGLTRTL